MNKQVNVNRIVRVHDEEFHHLFSNVSRLTKVPYQHVFSEFLEMLKAGYLYGSETELVLIKRVLVRYSEQ